MSDDNFKVDFIGIGAPRCATTWIFQCLKEHPEICGSHPKETEFFRQERKYKRGLGFYNKSFFNHCSKENLRGEFTTFYLSDEQAPQRIYNSFPNVKLIISLRDPVERFYSHYRLAKKRGELGGHYKSLEEAVKKRDYRHIKLGKYGKHLTRWLEFFPKENMHIILYKEIKSHPNNIIQDLYNFLGVNSEFVPSTINKKENVTGTEKVKLKMPRFLNLIHAITNKIKKRNRLYSLLNRTPLKRLHSGLVSWNKEKKKTGKANPTSVEDMDQEIKKKLHQIYKEDLNKLDQLIDKDLSHWKYE